MVSETVSRCEVVPVPSSVRLGTVAEAMAVERALAEFAHPNSESTYRARLNGVYLILVAEQESGVLVGFKVGYGLDEHTFYSWVGGVVAGARRGRVASALLEAQESWAKEHGFTKIRVKSKNEFGAMLTFLIGAGYQIVGTEGTGPLCKIIFERRISVGR